MTGQDRQAFAELLLGLGETYGEPVSDARMEIYFAALADLDLADVRKAATVLVRASKFFPRPSELREGANGSQDDRAEIAWLDLQRLVRSIGYTGTPDFGGDIALKRTALQLYGGWVRLCSSLPADGPELLGVAKQFKAAYRAYDNRAQRQLLAEQDSHELTPDECRKALSGVMARLKTRSTQRGAETLPRPKSDLVGDGANR